MVQGEGIVEFSDHRALKYALDNLSGTELDGSKITVIAETIDGRPTGKGSLHDLENKNLRGLPGKEKEKRESRSRSKERSRSPLAIERPGFSQ